MSLDSTNIVVVVYIKTSKICFFPTDYNRVGHEEWSSISTTISGSVAFVMNFTSYSEDYRKDKGR
jgi:hypothetical protein